MNLLVAQCGGPTAVINASLAAFIAAGQQALRVEGIWGARLGLEGLLQGDWVELSALSAPQLAQLARQPGAALGGGRYRASPAELLRAVARLQERGIGGVALIGGNGTMAAAQALADAARRSSTPLAVVGIPKTIDNDLAGTDVAPGFGSAARFISETVRAVGLDLYSMRHFDDVVVVEVMGRHAGWLTAAAVLARDAAQGCPHLILVPEVPLVEEVLLARVAAVHAARKYCLIVAAEGVQDEAQRYLAEKQGALEEDGSGQRLLSLAAGVAPYLAAQITRQLGLRCRQIRPDLIQRSCHLAFSELDLELARRVGATAAEALATGISDVMLGLVAEDGWRVQPVPLASVIEQTQRLPAYYYSGVEFDITPAGSEDLRRRTGLLAPPSEPLLW